MTKNEDQFYQDLKNIFIGAKIEGNSGFVNLMKIKSSYLEKILKSLKTDIDRNTVEFPDFKDELFTRLHTFFGTYFSESGSIYFSYTPLKSKIYERIYTNNQDVILFWKTNMLYYVKTDNIYKSLSINYEIEGSEYTIKFDASHIEGKRSNEKRILIFKLDGVKDKTVTFKPLYSEHGKETNVSEILKSLHKNSINLMEEQLDELFRIFKKQTEVDYFINKDAKAFLKEQFDLWLKNYIFDDESDYSEKRLKQLKILKHIAYKVIDFVAQFEDELVNIWNKPKFVLNSNYVITLDRIANRQEGIETIKKIFDHEGIKEQIKEWKELNIVDEKFDKNSILQKELNGDMLNEKYKFLPIDTKYFKDLELDILSLFDDLDKELDGWLIHSENYQVLNTILPKFKGKVQAIYIDPPFNKEQDADYFYSVKYKDATWITMLENRIRLGRELLNERGSIFVRCDYNGNAYVRMLLNEIFGKENFRNEITIAKSKEFFKTMTHIQKFSEETESLFLFSKTPNMLFNLIYREKDKPSRYEPFLPVKDKSYQDFRIVDGKKVYSPKGRKWGIKQEDIEKFLNENRLIFDNGKWYLITYEEPLKDVWIDFQGYSRNWEFKTENSEIFIKRAIQSTSNEGDLVLDFFLGSGTTTAVAHKLKRKWVGIEMGEHFYTLVLPRMKKVLAYDKSEISKDDDVKENYNEKTAGGFFKYYDLEQYEQTLRKCHYIPSEPFFDLDDKSIYEQYVFLKDPKLLDAMDLDYKNNKINVRFDDIYPNIDIAETLSNLKGKWIKKITNDSVVLKDDNNEEEIRFDNIDFKTIKPLIWW
ncbi:site-specific DNA-methyltransferase [Acidiplasma aeolicum]|jgi:adenine-specific DNA-methyltransferase|uniref:site-specific DNA-methyltransferase n=1 Tax=Acidiplasma aeolicum TaxID=507754 RepID=UPI00372482F7